MSEENDRILEILLDFANALESACVQLRRDIAELKGLEEKPKFQWNPNVIKWEKAQGSRGEFEKSEDFNNPEFKSMLKDLASHNGKLTREGWFYWVYKNGSTVGRKKREAKR